MKKTVTRQFPDAVINTIDANGVSLTKKQKGAEVNLFFDDTGTPRCAEIYSLDEETSEHAEIGLFFDGIELVDYDGFDDIDTALRNSANSVDSDAYGDYLQEQLINAFEEYGGKVIEFTNENVSFTVNLEKYIAEMDDGDGADVEDLVGRCGLDMSCLFDELRSYGWINRPKPNFDDQWYNRNFDEKYFNEIVSDNLYEFLNK